MNRRRQLTLLLAAVLIPLMVSAQKYFRSFGAVQGLADNTVYCIGQDERGFLWMGTANGLCRFDGLFFTTYRNLTGDSTSLACNIVRDVLPVAGGLWIATDKGIDFLSFADGRFHHCRHQGKPTTSSAASRFNHFVKTSNRLYAIDNAGNLYRQTDDWLFETVNQHGQRYDALAGFRDDLLLAAGPKGLYLLEEDGETVMDHLQFEANITSLVNIYFSKNKGTVFLGYGIGYESRAFRIENNRIRESQAYVPPSLMATRDFGSSTAFGIDGGGLMVDDGVERRNYTPYNSNINGDAVYSLFVDKDNNMWIGTYRMGINLYSECFRWFSILNRANRQLSYDIVTAIVPDGHRLFIGLDGGGLEIYNRQTHERRTFTQSNSRMPGDNVVSVLKDGGQLWLAVYTKGLVRFSIADQRFKTWQFPIVDPDANNVWTLCDDSLGNIWVGGPDLFVFNKQTEQITPVGAVNRADCSSLSLQGAYIWMATRYKGLYKLDRRTRKVVRHYDATSGALRLPPGDLAFVYADGKGRVWFSGEQGGFYRLDEKKGDIRTFGIDEGLTCTCVRSMEEDAEGNLLVGTSNGLFCLSSGKNIFVRLDVDESVSEFTPNCSANDGHNMYFGTTKGLVWFSPSQLHISTTNHAVSFTRLTLADNEKTPFDLYLDDNGAIRLDHDQNFFTVSYAVPELVSPDHVHFSCMLQGLEHDWRDMGRRREVSYTNVPPGEYRLLVRCTNSDGRWGEPSVLQITVTPPWYLSWWAKLSWALIGGCLVFVAIRFYLRELRIKHQMELTEVEKASARRLNEAKTNFYTSIIHELRTPVFLITAQLEEILENTKDTVKVPYTYLAAIHRYSLRLNELISRIIDFRKIGAENLSLSLQRADVVAFCEAKTENYTDMFRQKEIAYGFRASAHEIPLDFDPLKLELIVSNLISNAFKYTKRGGHVELSVTDEPDRVVFAVQDNGIGIDERVRDTIFESFFRSERGKRQGEGDGLGLSYVKNLVELHGGKITVDSEMGEGSTFTFFIPKKTEAIAPETLAFQPHIDNPAATHTILIVDDERETVELLERYLEKDFHIEKAYDGEEGLAKTYESLPDIILLDLTMPRMSGLEMLTRIRRDKKLQHIKVIVFTAKTAEDDMLSAFDKGADVYLTKPVSLKLLRKRIDKLVGSPAEASVTISEGTERKTYTKEEQKFLLRVREIIDDNLQNPEFSIAFLADQLGMSHSPLYKKLKQMTGMSLIEFVNDYRIYKAVQLFRQGETNVETVANAVGINDVKNFRTLFRRKMQMTPKQYVQNL